MKTNREEEFTAELFGLIKDRIEGEGLNSNEALAGAMLVEQHIACGYVSAIRESRPWCISTSLRIAECLGWTVGVGFRVPEWEE